jgi:hypothetical protein
MEVRYGAPRTGHALNLRTRRRVSSGRAASADPLPHRRRGRPVADICVAVVADVRDQRGRDQNEPTLERYGQSCRQMGMSSWSRTIGLTRGSRPRGRGQCATGSRPCGCPRMSSRWARGVALPEETASGAAPHQRAGRVSVRNRHGSPASTSRPPGDDSGENLVSERVRGVVRLFSLIGEQTHTRCAGTRGSSLAGDL